MDEVIDRIVRVASRAPSAHNAQPWRVDRVDGGLHVGLHGDRLLRVGDQTGRDALLGIGCWVEAAAIAAADAGATLDVVSDDEGLAAFSAEPTRAPAEPLVRIGVARATGESGAPSGSVGAAARFTADDVLERAVHRGRLLPIASDGGMGEALGEPWLRIARVPAARAPRLLGLGDAGSMGRRAVAHEALDWTRFTPRDPRFDRDGLTGPTLMLPPPAAAVAGALTGSRAGRAALEACLAAGARLAPATTGIGRSRPGLFALVADGRSVGAQGIAGNPSWPVGLPPHAVLDAGRALLRAWLAAHRSHVAVAPASQVVDAPRALAALRRGLGLRAADVALAVFAAGTPTGPAPRSPRLPPA